MMITWKYTLPAFLVPFAFTLNPDGLGLLLKGSVTTIVWSSLTAALGVGALAFGAGGWLKQRASLAERILAVAAGLLLIYPSSFSDLAGAAVLAVAVGLNLRPRDSGAR